MAQPLSVEQLKELVQRQSNVIVTTGTGGSRIQDVDTDYQSSDRMLVANFRRLRLEPPFPWRTLWEWHGFYSQNLGTYASRRQHVGQLTRAALDALDALAVNEGVAGPAPASTSEVVRAALGDAEVLIREGRPSSAVDRVHTALHGHVRALCVAESITVPEGDPSITVLLKVLRENHSRFKETVAFSDEARRMIMSMSTALDALNTIRNHASLAHANEALLGDPEAHLAIDSARTVFRYVDAKVA